MTDSSTPMDSTVTEAVAPKTEEELRWHVARALSIPQHHTTWDTLTEQEKDLFYMQADAAILAMRSASLPSGGDEQNKLRQQGQDEGFASAVQWLRDRGAMKPPATLWHAASLLADQMEQSRIPRQALSKGEVEDVMSNRAGRATDGAGMPEDDGR